MKTWTLDSIRSTHESRSLHFFDIGWLRGFRTRLYYPIYQGRGGVYFVTSEKFVSFGAANPRRFTVRKFDPVSAAITTFGPFNQLSHERAERLARIAAEHPDTALQSNSNSNSNGGG
jgi:hypothetical protein